MLQPRRNTVFILTKAADRILNRSTKQYNTEDNHVTVKTDQRLLDTVCICSKLFKHSLTSLTQYTYVFSFSGLRRLKPPRGAGWEPQGSDGRQSPKLLVVAALRAN